MASRNCYTYLISWSWLDLHYYGVRYAEGCDPSDLWVTYFTSSNNVRACRDINGEPDIVRVRRKFGNDPASAVDWERRVLLRIKAGENSRFLNLARRNSFKGTYTSWNKGLTKNSCPILAKISRKISARRKGKLASVETKEKMRKIGQARKAENSWNQLRLYSKLYERFGSYDDFTGEVKDLYEECWGIPAVIAERMNVTLYGVGTAIVHLGFDPVCDKSMAKVYRNYREKFSSYSDYCISILVLHGKGYTPSQIGIQLGVNECGVNSLLKRLSLDKHKAKTGPSSPEFKKILVIDALEATGTTFTLENNTLPEDIRVKLREALSKRN